ncbi:GTPase family protein [Rahnella sp. NRRL B-41462]|uniref:GTPase family protein n=1 Tax=Rahnella sp. NRRL B-41462 TaxID=1610579 RepID=UPI001E5742E0|nr:GTPase [Rahnella sp. NRRL B-41462]
MPDKTEQGISALTQPLSFLPESLSLAILKHIHQCIHYEPTIGIMGKTGVGKSSLCNTLFTPPPAKVSAVKGCTRQVQRYQLSLAPYALLMVDFPGIGETPELDRIYTRLYQHWLSQLDLIIWVLKADDRAWNDDIRCYNQLISQGADPARFLFVLNQADKIEPCREWDLVTHQPSLLQQQHLQVKIAQVNALFSPQHPVLAVSASEGFNMLLWAETFICALPDNASSAVIRQLEPEYRTKNVINTAKDNFAHGVGDIFDDALCAMQATGAVVRQFKRLRQRLLSVVRAVWHLLF